MHRSRWLSFRPGRLVLVFAAMWVCASPAVRAATSLPEGTFAYGAARGNDYRTWTALKRQMYVGGLIDGLLFAPAVGGKTTFVVALSECIAGLPYAQLTAVTDKALADHPAHWDAPMNWLVFDALEQFCSARGKPLEPH